MTKKLRTIALNGSSFIKWGGGVDFFRSCINALQLATHTQDIRLVVLLPDPGDYVANAISFISSYKKIFQQLIEGKIPHYYRYKPFSKNQLNDSFSNIEGNVEIIYFNSFDSLKSVLERIKADVVLPSVNSLGESFPVPWIGYLYDFQHIYHPEFFTKKDYESRNKHFPKMLYTAKAAVVNSSSVKNDIIKYYPESSCKVFSLPFSATPIESWFEPPINKLAEVYQLPENYFVISNQFWIHKDHETAFKALETLIEMTGRHDIHIVCTGKTDDYRQPKYFSRLQIMIQELNLHNKIHFLGYIPKKDQIDILCGSIAVLQPTLFEGGPGGGAVYDAVAMGVPAILSDIAVNKEIEGEDRLYYFKAGAAEDMALKMVRVLDIKFSKPKKEELIKLGNMRTKKFGETLLKSIEYVIRNR